MKKTKSKDDLMKDFMKICSEIEELSTAESFYESDFEQLEECYNDMIENMAIEIELGED